MPRTIIWVTTLACLAIAISMTSPALAQDDQNDANPQDSQSDQQSYSDTDQQNEQQTQQGEQQYQQDQQTRSQQDQQRSQQDRQRSGQRQWDDQQSRDPNQQYQPGSQAWNRDEFRRAPQTGEFYRQPDDSYRQSSQAGRNEEEGGLGIAIVSDGERGILVARVYRNTPADQMGLRPGDRITQVNGQQVQSTQDFISRIRSMNPGDEVALDVLRDREERSFSGELETRQEALVLRNRQMQQQGSGWQTEFNQPRGGEFYSSPSQPGRGGDVMSRISAIERQLNSLRNELQNLRSSLQQGQAASQFDQRGRQETAASYDESQPQRQGDIRTTSREWQDQNRPQQFDRYQEGGQSRQYGGYQDDIRTNRPGVDDSPGGETGEDRLRPNEDQLNER